MHVFVAHIKNIGIDHRVFDIVVAQEFPYASDIVTALHQGAKQENIKYDVAASEIS